MLPSASPHLVIRLGGRPLRLFAGPEDTVGTSVSHAVVGGVRHTAYLKDAGDPAPTVGAVFRPGAAAFFLGAPAGAFAGRHTPLDAFWGASVGAITAHLLEAPDGEGRLAILEAALLQRLPQIRGIDPAIARAAALLKSGRAVGDVVAELDRSHRRFIAEFSEAVGLAPKLYARLARFGRVLAAERRRPLAAWADVAAWAGYADQPHFNRDFRAFAGISPGRYRALGGSGRHVAAP